MTDFPTTEATMGSGAIGDSQDSRQLHQNRAEDAYLKALLAYLQNEHTERLTELLHACINPERAEPAYLEDAKHLFSGLVGKDKEVWAEFFIRMFIEQNGCQRNAFSAFKALSPWSNGTVLVFIVKHTRDRHVVYGDENRLQDLVSGRDLWHHSLSESGTSYLIAISPA